MNNDILFYTCQFISTKDLVKLRPVCKNWMHTIDLVLRQRTIDFINKSQLDFVVKVKPKLCLYWNDYTDSCARDLKRVETLHLYQDVSLCDTFVDVNELHIYSATPELPHSMYKLTKLQRLDISVNCLNIVPPSLFTLVNLTRLNFSCNTLTDSMIQGGINFLSNLKWLDLSYNNLKRFTLSLQHLEYLKVTGNSLTNLNLTGCNSLITLIANFNKLQDLPCLPNLETIELIENKLTQISQNIQMCKNLKRLCLYRNQIQTVSNYINLCPLLYLNLSQNEIQEITLCIPTLLDLYLDGNAFIKISFINCYMLGILSLSHCFIYTIPPEWPSQTRNLSILLLDYNGLVHLDGLENWKQLKHLDVSFNCLTCLPNTLTRLDYLNTTCNYIKNVPNEIKSIKKLIT
jgi:Leucine-rich repeat (LRR) protein